MTKFAQAKKQTLRKWEAILWSWVDTKCKRHFRCGFCLSYNTSKLENAQGIETCCLCPIFRLEEQDCSVAILSKGIRNSGFWVGTPTLPDQQIPLVMALLIYLWGMEDKG